MRLPFAESIHLLMALGATRVRVHYEYGWDQGLAVELSVPVKPAVDVSSKLKSKKSTRTSLLFEAQFDAHPPSLPSDLVWYAHEPTWQLVAAGRLTAGMRNFSRQVRYTDDYGIDADLAGKVKKVKLGLGGDFQKHVATSWRIEGEFGGDDTSAPAA
jgi:hypothetical protein